MSLKPLYHFNLNFFENKYIYVDWVTSFALWHADLAASKTLPYVRTSTGRIALDLLLQCGGSAFIPETLASKYLSDGVLKHVEEMPKTSREVFIAYHKDNDQKEVIEKVISILTEVSMAQDLVEE